MGVTDQPPEQPRQPKLKTERTTRIKVIMGSRAVQHFHRRNPSQHRVLASIIDDMNKENLKMQKSGARITNVPIDIEPMEVEQENLESRRRIGRPEKKVTWSRDLLQVRSISPRQKSPRTPRMAAAAARTSRMSEAVKTLRSGPPLTQEGGSVKDCGHFLCQRVAGVCLQGGSGGEQQGGGNLRPGFQAANTGYQATSGYQNLPCSPQMQTVVWRSIPISRTSNNNNNNSKRAGLTLDIGNAFLQGEALV